MRRAAQGPMTVDAAFDALLERARTELANDPVLQADVLDDFGEIRANQGRFDEARELFDEALAVAEREFHPNHPAVAESLLNLAFIAPAETSPSRAPTSTPQWRSWRPTTAVIRSRWPTR